MWLTFAILMGTLINPAEPASFLTTLVFTAISASTAPFAQESEKGALRWSFEMQGGIESPAVAADGTIYVASADTNLYALSPEGKRKWVFKTGGPIDSSPAIAADGTIYVGSYDNNLYAITPEGKQKWTFTGGFRFSTPALAADGTIYATNRDRKIYALTPEGKLKWSVQIKCDFFPADSSAAVGADGTVYVGGCDNQLHAFTPEGKSQWASAVAGNPNVSSPALGADGTIYVANKSQPGFLTLYAFTPQGKLKWSFETPSGSMANPPVIALDGTIYYATEWLYALTPEGKRKWEFHEGEDSSPPAIGADGTIYRTAWGNALYAITPEGTLKWSLKTGSRLSSSPVIGADGTVYAGTSPYAENKKNTLFAFRVSSRGYAAGPWSSDQARWMKHGGGQPAVEQATAPAVAELRRIPAPSSESGSQPAEAVAEPEKRREKLQGPAPPPMTAEQVVSFLRAPSEPIEWAETGSDTEGPTDADVIRVVRELRARLKAKPDDIQALLLWAHFALIQARFQLPAEAQPPASEPESLPPPAVALDRVLAAQPHNAEALLLKGRITFASDPGKALILLRQALEFAPGNRRYSLFLAQALAEQGRPGEAAQILRSSHKNHPVIPFLEDLDALGIPEGGELVFDGATQHNTSSPESEDACGMCAFTMADLLSNARLEDPWRLRMRIYYFKKSPAEIEAFYSNRIPGFRFIEEKEKQPGSQKKRDRSYDQFVQINSGGMKPVSDSSELRDFARAKDGISLLLLDINDHPHLKRKLAPGEHICYLMLTNLRK